MSIKNKALDKLKEKFEGVSESVLSRIAQKIAKTAEDEEAAIKAVEETTFQQVIDSYTESRVAEATETSVKNYEKKHKLKDGKPIEDVKETEEKEEKPDEETPAYIRALTESISALKSEISVLKDGKVADMRKSTLKELTSKLSDKAKKSYMREFSRAKFKNDDDFNSWIEEITPEIEEAEKEQNALDAHVKQPGGKGGEPPKEADEKVVSQVEQMLNAGVATPAIQGLPTTNDK